MTEDAASPSILDDNCAEGLPHYDEPRAPSPAGRVLIVPTLKRDSRGGPSGETGILPAAVIPAESMSHDDAQDASRTTAEARPVPATQKVAERRASRLPSVLIVEDAAELAEMLQLSLQRLPVVTAYETHGLRALARYRDMKPDVLIVDIGLPDMTGWELLATIRQELPPSAAMPIVIIMTAYGDATNRLAGKLQNVDSYLVKPFTTSEVERAVRRALAGRVG